MMTAALPENTGEGGLYYITFGDVLTTPHQSRHSSGHMFGRANQLTKN